MDIEDILSNKVTFDNNNDKSNNNDKVILNESDKLNFENCVYQYCLENTDIEFEKYLKQYVSNLKKSKIKFNIYLPKYCFGNVYKDLVKNNKINRNSNIEKYLKINNVRENSGVLVFTLVMSPYPYGTKDKHSGEFTCKYNCYYCPKYPDMPRSYIADEPAVSRALRCNWDPIEQFIDRINSYKNNSMDLDNGIKAEVILEGGTYNSYPEEYRIDFIHKIYYIANIITKDTINKNIINKREMLSLYDEQKLNESAFCKIVGLSIETRPDQINIDFITELRLCGVTRVQIGVQHTNDYILKKINRECYTKDTKYAMRLLKNTGFKIAIHIMPDLPFSSYEIDKEMFRHILNDIDISFDYIKIYPVMVTDYTVIKKWYDSGKYKPYSETLMNYEINGKVYEINPLIPLIADFQKDVPPWVRNERTIRDIPINSKSKNPIIFGGCKVSNLRNYIDNFMELQGYKCMCIRCREVKNKIIPNDIEIVTRHYLAHNGIEYFISYENKNRDTIYGFCRLRIPNNNDLEIVNSDLKELINCALIRELHIYGKMNSVGNKSVNDSAQHRGLGNKLLTKAENIARKHNFSKIAVISAVGTKNYYKKYGYEDNIYYQIKKLEKYKNYDDIKLLILIISFIFIIMCFFLN